MIELSELKRAEEYVLSTDSYGFLTLGWRNCLWDELLTVDFQHGPLRRTVLGVLVAEETLPKWDRLEDVAEVFRDLPYKILAYCRRVIIGDHQFREACDAFGDFEGEMDEFHANFETMRLVPNDDEYITTRWMWRSYAVEASLAALYRAVWWEHEFENRYNATDGDSDRKDTHFLSALDCCDDSRKSACQRRYWLHWLHDLFPRVLVDIEDVRDEITKNLN